MVIDSGLRETLVARIKAHTFPNMDRASEKAFAERLANDILAIPEIKEALACKRVVENSVKAEQKRGRGINVTILDYPPP